MGGFITLTTVLTTPPPRSFILLIPSSSSFQSPTVPPAPKIEEPSPGELPKLTLDRSSRYSHDLARNDLRHDDLLPRQRRHVRVLPAAPRAREGGHGAGGGDCGAEEGGAGAGRGGGAEAAGARGGGEDGEGEEAEGEGEGGRGGEGAEEERMGVGVRVRDEEGGRQRHEVDRLGLGLEMEMEGCRRGEKSPMTKELNSTLIGIVVVSFVNICALFSVRSSR